MALTENEKRTDKKEKPLTKVVIRRLPPSMDQVTFLTQVSPIPEYNYIYTAKGDSSLGEFAFTRVYINFVNSNDIYDFKERFDNYVFLDNHGHEYPAVVEFTPFQKIPKKRGKARMDPKCGTVETDPIFQEFLKNLSKPKEQEEKPEYTLQLTSENKNEGTTPLLEYIKTKRAQKMRLREVRREERKNREYDKRKERFDERKKIPDNHSQAVVSNSDSPKLDASNEDKAEVSNSLSKGDESHKTEKIFEKSFYKSKDRKYEERPYDDRKKEIKLRYPKKDYHDRDYKKKDEYREKEHRSKYDDYKKDDKNFPKKVKKYSERREERKMVVQKSIPKSNIGQDKNISNDLSDKPKHESSCPENEFSVTNVKSGESSDRKSEDNKHIEEGKKDDKTSKESKKDSDMHAQKRIRNKDRPTIAIYRPGMLSKRRQNDVEDLKDSKVEPK